MVHNPHNQAHGWKGHYQFSLEPQELMLWHDAHWSVHWGDVYKDIYPSFGYGRCQVCQEPDCVCPAEPVRPCRHEHSSWLLPVVVVLLVIGLGCAMMR